MSTPCLHYHPSLGIRAAGHVDDLMCVGPRSGLDMFLAKLKCVCDLISTFPGPDAEEERRGESFLVEVFAGGQMV